MRRRSITFIERKLRAESRNTDCLVGMSIGVKGCKMPARSRRPVSLPENSPGRRLTSLKGGNRGRQPQGYGDLIVGSVAAAPKAGGY
jgi:hypothetical protein